MGSAVISVTSNGTYNTFGVETYLTRKGFTIRGGNINFKASALGGATITPEIDYNDNKWAVILAPDGGTVRTMTTAGDLNFGPLKVGMRLRYVVTGYTAPFTIDSLC